MIRFRVPTIHPTASRRCRSDGDLGLALSSQVSSSSPSWIGERPRSKRRRSRAADTVCM
jgi:hypothetical protein